MKGLAERVPFELIVSRQKTWAQTKGITLNEDQAYVSELKDNLLSPLSQDNIAEFNTGGQEMNNHMLALHSSSALALNFFHFWRKLNRLDVLGNCVFKEPNFKSLRFEASFPTGLMGTAPHLDVLLEGNNAKPVAIESKFTEPYSKILSEPEISNSYFNDALWAGLPKSYSLLKRIHGGELVFQRLDAVQLLKHTLGLSKYKHFGAFGFRLFLLWYDFASEMASKMEREIEVFLAETRDEIDFQSLSYQDAFLSLSEHKSICPDYFTYMQERYFVTA